MMGQERHLHWGTSITAPFMTLAEWNAQTGETWEFMT